MRRLYPCLLLLLIGCEIRPLDPVTGKAIVEESHPVFDAATFVETNWESRIVPAFQTDAIDVKVLRDALAVDAEAASAQYGHREGTRPYNVIVRGVGRVLAADTTSRVGTLAVDLPPYDGRADVSLQVGPVIRGTALRDALPFIAFNQFVNQLEYANVSNALHARLVASVLAGLEPYALVNREIRFSGAYTIGNDAVWVITPVTIQVEGGM